MCEPLRMNAPYDTITSDPQRRGGRPCVRDLRISVGDVLGWLAEEQTVDQIVADYPELTPSNIRACLAFAAAQELHEVRLAAAGSCCSPSICHGVWCQPCRLGFKEAARWPCWGWSESAISNGATTLRGTIS